MFGELDLPIVSDVPLIHSLGVDGGFRFSDYTNKGVSSKSEYKTSTYKLEFHYAPTRDIRLRASYNRAVRAPNIAELFQSQGLGNISASDPCAGASPAASFQACQASGVTEALYGKIPECPAETCVQQFGGNPDVKPEKADTYTIGAVFTPTFLPDFTMSLDYYRIKVDGYIGSIDPALTIKQCVATGNPFFCDLFHRDPRSGVLFGTDGYVVATTQNTGYLKTDGIDINQLDQNAAGGTVNVDAGGTITVVDAQNGVTGTDGQVELDANGAAASIAINASVTSSSGDINVLADDDVTFDATSDVTTTSGNVTITGDANAGGSGTDGAVTMADGAVIDAGSGTIDIDADEDVSLSTVTTTNTVFSKILKSSIQS